MAWATVVITLLACSPTSALRMPFTLSEGRLIASMSDLPGNSVRASPSSARSASSALGAAAIAAFSSSPSGTTSSYQPGMVTRPSSSFIDASSRASIIPGFGAQLP